MLNMHATTPRMPMVNPMACLLPYARTCSCTRSPPWAPVRERSGVCVVTYTCPLWWFGATPVQPAAVSLDGSNNGRRVGVVLSGIRLRVPRFMPGHRCEQYA